MSGLLFGKAEFDSAQNIRETEDEIIVSAILERESILQYGNTRSYKSASELQAAAFTLENAWIVAYRHTRTPHIVDRSDIRGRIQNVSWNPEIGALVGECHFVKSLCDADINLGIYPNHRSDELRMMAGYFKEHYNRVKPEVKSVFEIKKLRGKLFSGMVWAGIGCTLIKRRVFEKTRFVYDQQEYLRKVGVHDQLFLFGAQQNGFQVLLHGDVVCGHLPQWSLCGLEEVISEH